MKGKLFEQSLWVGEIHSAGDEIDRLAARGQSTSAAGNQTNVVIEFRHESISGGEGIAIGLRQQLVFP